MSFSARFAASANYATTQRSELMVLSEKTLYWLGRRCVYIFNRRKAKKEIPDNALTGQVPSYRALSQDKDVAHTIRRCV